jgi:type IV pilus assembly protein PilA
MNVALNDWISRSRQRRREDRGFTLIELIVVVVILAVLAAIGIPIYLNQVERARDSAVSAAISTAKTTLVAKSVETGTWPTANSTEISTNQTLINLTDANVTLRLTGTATTFCIRGVHAQAATRFFYATHERGVSTTVNTPPTGCAA